jgi:3-methyladenine DNA glycosylase AlkD
MTADDARAALRAVAEPDRVPELARYFRAVPGGYGEGDRFIGVRVPQTRKVARAAARAGMTLDTALELLLSDVHEERLFALLVMVRRHERGDAAVFDAYLAHTDRVNNWDLVDASAPAIVGGTLVDGPAGLLDRLVVSTDVWERRIALLATLTFIRAGRLDDTYRLGERVLGDPHDLIHKAAGWMLREAGARDEPRLIAFLDRHVGQMPRTMLRSALEKVDAAERARLLTR